MEEVDKGRPMIRMGVSGRVFLLVSAYPGSPEPKAVKRLSVRVFVFIFLFLTLCVAYKNDYDNVHCSLVITILVKALFRFKRWTPIFSNILTIVTSVKVGCVLYM